MAEWAVVTTMPASERGVIDEINRRFKPAIPVILFKRKFQVVRRGRVRDMFAPAFPRSLFVPLEDCWRVRNEVWRVRTIVANESDCIPWTAPQATIDALTRRCQRDLEDGSYVLPPLDKPEPFRRGDMLYIRGASSFYGQCGSYEGVVDEQTVLVGVQFLGRTVEVAFDLRDVELSTGVERSKKRRRRKRRRGRERHSDGQDRSDEDQRAVSA